MALTECVDETAVCESPLARKGIHSPPPSHTTLSLPPSPPLFHLFKPSPSQRSCRDDLLKNFLLLVLLLDKTLSNPSSKLPSGVPPLFDVKAPLKSSKQVC